LSTARLCQCTAVCAEARPSTRRAATGMKELCLTQALTRQAPRRWWLAASRRRCQRPAAGGGRGAACAALPAALAASPGVSASSDPRPLVVVGGEDRLLAARPEYRAALSGSELRRDPVSCGEERERRRRRRRRRACSRLGVSLGAARACAPSAQSCGRCSTVSCKVCGT
jgi:hypothetical protein